MAAGLMVSVMVEACGAMMLTDTQLDAVSVMVTAARVITTVRGLREDTITCCIGVIKEV